MSCSPAAHRTGLAATLPAILRAAAGTALCAALAACSSSPTTQVGGPCDSKKQCDDGQVCDLSAAGGPVCLDGAADADGDGIPNDKDFCLHTAGGAFDEDGDGLGDECDACPVGKPPNPAESDGDPVDKPCDPDPGTPGDKILLFNGFNAAVAGADPAWKFEGGEAIATPPDATTTLSLMFPLGTATNHLEILTSYRVDAVMPGAAEADATVQALNRLPKGDSTVSCGGARPTGAGDVLALTTAANGSSSQNVVRVANAFGPGVRYGVLELLDGAQADCALAGDVPANSGASRLSSDGSAPNFALLLVRGAIVRFAYIVVAAH
jgi:hypothetical protein